MAWLMLLLIFCCISIGKVNITEENCEDLLTAADMLSVTGVVDACCLFMRERFQPENCIGTFSYFIFFILVRDNNSVIFICLIWDFIPLPPYFLSGNS